MDFPEIVRRFAAAAAKGDGVALADLFAEDGVYVDGFYGAFQGRAAIAAMLRDHFFSAARDFRWEMLDPVGNDRVGYARYLFSYTSTLPDSAGRRVAFEGVGIFELEGGRIRRYREVFDKGIALAQLDFAPERIKKSLLRWAREQNARPDFGAHVA